MDNINTLEINESDNDKMTYFIILWFITLMNQKDVEVQWNALSKEIKEKSRFFPVNPIIENLKKYSAFATQK